MGNPNKDFDVQKKICLDKLYKPDKSRKGDVDESIIPLIDHINSLDDYYTTSSCSGRIQLLTEAAAKPAVKWIYVSHDIADENAIIVALKNEIPLDRVWLRQENMILHIACRDINCADALLKIAREDGFRRSGIIADSNVIIVEICSTEKMDVPVSEKGRLVVDDDYIRLIVKIANEKFLKGKEKLEKLEKDIREYL